MSGRLYIFLAIISSLFMFLNGIFQVMGFEVAVMIISCGLQPDFAKGIMRLY